mgnify:CR=1 FL=1
MRYLFFLILTLASCAMPTVTPLNGKILIDKEARGSQCKVIMTYQNHEQAPLAPEVRFIVFDASANTTAQGSIYFDTVLGGKQQQKFSYISSPCKNVQKLVVTYARDRKYRNLPMAFEGAVFTR